MKKIFIFLSLVFVNNCFAQVTANFVKENFIKKDTLIKMRDGIKLYTIIYLPKDYLDKKYPFLIERTPYSSGPYGDTSFARSIGPNPSLMKEKYIFVYQDVRGRYMSEGINLEVTPAIPKKKSSTQVDESSDMFDTVDWLLKNIKNNNGRVGVYGISYPGFYATACMPGAHPAIKAVSPQAPITDEFAGDDVYHNGAFFLMDNFAFINYFDKERKGPIKNYGSDIFKLNTKDAYRFFLNLGPISNTQLDKYFNHQSKIWNEYLTHNTYDDYWQSRNIRNYINNINIPTLVVGGWFDAEDLFGTLNTYKTLNNSTEPNNHRLVMGPWTHGAWSAAEWKQYASHDFGSNTSIYFQDSIETVFFNYYLKDKGMLNLAEATIFETGSNKWTTYKSWPPSDVEKINFYLNASHRLSNKKEVAQTDFEVYTSDTEKPVPYTGGIYGMRNNDYMAEDQRFASTRPDVLVYESDPLEKDMTITGDILTKLYVSTTGSDADFIVKVIDVLSDNEPNFKNAPKGFQMAGYQRMVRAEVIRGKFRNSLENPEPFVPGKIDSISLTLNDIAHTFKKGHKIMVQIQSSWFPLVDRNPQKFMNITEAASTDFQKENIRIYHTLSYPSHIIFPLKKSN